MALLNLNKKFVNINDCTNEQKFSFANLVSFPEAIPEDLFSNAISEIIITDSGMIIGGYIVTVIAGYQVLFIEKIKVNPKLKSSKYMREILDRVIEVGMSIYDENFKGVVGLSFFENKKEKKIEVDFMDVKGYTISYGSIIRDKSARLSYMPVNGGYTIDEVKEFFETIKNNI